MDFNGFSNLVFLQRKVTGKTFIIAEASWFLSSRAEADSLKLQQLPHMAGSLFSSSKSPASPVPSLALCILHTEFGAPPFIGVRCQLASSQLPECTCR